MKIESLNALKKLMKLCREQGINAIEIDGIKLEFGNMPYVQQKVKQNQQVSYQAAGAGIITEDLGIDTPDELTEEQLLNWSSAPGGQQMGPN